MTLEHREQGETRAQILQLLRRQGQMTAAELSDALGIGAVGVRQHLALLDRDNLVRTNGVRRGVGRPSHLYMLTERAEALFPKRYDRLALDAIAFVEAQGGAAACSGFVVDDEYVVTNFESAERPARQSPDFNSDAFARTCLIDLNS